MKYPAYYHAVIWEAVDGVIQRLDGKSVFVVGGTGFFGGWFVDFLEYARDWRGLDVRVYSGSRATGLDVLDQATYPATLKDADYVINCSGDSNGVDIDAHRLGPDILRHEMRWDAVLLQMSSGAAKSATPYGFAKSGAERDLMRTKRRSQIARVHSVIGPGLSLDKSFAVSSFIRAALAGEPLQVSVPAVTRSFCHVTDLVVQSLYVMLAGDGQPYEVGSEDAVGLDEVARAISPNVELTEAQFASNANQSIYVADLSRLRTIFPDLRLEYDSLGAVRDTLEWHRARETA